jgi:probable O-glycosylation ligase (exosortase A-associated)
MRDIVLIGIVGWCSLLALGRPVLGILLFICLGLAGPQTMTWGMARTFPLGQLAALGTIGGFVFGPEAKRFPRQRELFLILALWGTFGFTTLFAMAPDRAVQRLFQNSKILFMVVLSTALINSKQRLHWLVRIIALSLGFYGLKGGLFVIMTGGDFIVWGPDGTFLEANNAIGLALAMNTPLLFYLLKIETHPWLRHLIIAMMVFSYPAVICTFSRGAWIGLAVATALMVLKSRHTVLAIAALGVVALALSPLLPERVAKRYDDLANYQEDSSAQSRFWSWEFCTRVGMANPLVGAGFDFNSLEAYAIYFPEFLERWPGKVWACHSTWLTVFSEHGFPGIILWGMLLGSSFLSLRWIRAFALAQPEAAWSLPYIEMLEGALIVFAVVGTFYDAAYFDLFYQLIAVIIIIKERLSSSIISPCLTKMSGNKAEMKPVAV